MKTIKSIGCGGILTTLLLSAMIGAFVWPYVINSWLQFFGKAAVVVWWQGILIGFCPWIGQAGIPAAMITFILMLFII